MQQDSNRRATGTWAERRVAAWLVAQGARILAMNLRVGGIEIDLLVREHQTIALVEVRFRSRRTFGGAMASISPRKQARLRRAAHLLWPRWRDAALAFRFDVACVEPSHEGAPIVTYVRGAFTDR